MPSRNGWRPSFEVALGLVKPTDEQRLVISQIKDNGHGSVACCLDNGYAHFRRRLVKVVFCVGQPFAVKEIFQRSTIAAKVACVNEEIGVRKGGLLQNHGF